MGRILLAGPPAARHPDTSPRTIDGNQGVVSVAYASQRRTVSILSVALALALAPACVPAPLPAGPTVFQVTTPADTFDGVCDAHCTLHDAVAAANADTTIDEIRMPAGTYPLALTTPVGADGDAFRVTDDLRLVGAGAASTVLDVDGRDVRAVWRTTAGLTIEGLTVEDVGSGTGSVPRTVVAAPMAAPDETVRLVDVWIDGVQPDATESGGAGNVGIVSAGGASNPTGHPFDIAVSSSRIERVGRGTPFVNLGAALTIADTVYDRAPAVLAGPPAPGANSFVPHDVDITGTTMINGTANVFSSCVHGVAVEFLAGADVTITDSALGGGAAGTCGGVPTGGSGASSAGAVVGLAGFGSYGVVGRATIRRSTLDGADQSNALGVLALGDATIPEVDVVDSTLLAGDGSALRVSALTLGPGQSPTGGRVGFEHVTLVGPPVGPGFGIVVPQAVPVHIANSVVVSGGAFLCGPGAALTSGGGNTFSDPSCALTGPGDHTRVEPLHAPLGDHGGTGRTRVPSASSPLVDTAVGSTSTADQRGFARPQGSGNDRGAVEGRPGD